MPKPVEHRTPNAAVQDVINHVEFKIASLPQLARRYGLSDEATASLLNYLQMELESLHQLPPDATFMDAEPLDENGRFARDAELERRFTSLLDSQNP